MNKPMNNVSRALQAAVMLLAIILLAMTASQATLAEGQTVLIVYGDEDAGNTENLHADWVSMIGSAGTLEEFRFSGYRKTMDATVAFTLDIYGHVTPTMQQESAERMQRLIDSI